ncbi:LLM class flavin-dependent oxidoreductase [Pseudomonas sp. LRF_L74]|uniref:LLM class flavin-dependent oxidoreductase n=1 Tax=Pseudomonas sp. LRF_L74 TaxID=3369422 RepID=UPI003F648BA3
MLPLAHPSSSYRPAAPLDFADSPLSQHFRQPLLLGLFLDVQDIRRSTLPRTSSWTFDYNAKLVQRAEELGFDMAFSRAQFLPKGDYDHQSLDAFIALGSMAAITERILLISTVHLLYGAIHPVHIAKFAATYDHIAKGRWGMNIVTGHRKVSHEMFGKARPEHDQRYELAAEYVETLERLWWESENFSYQSGNGWSLKDAFITPKPCYGRPILINATGSDAGIDFAARYSDMVFVTSPAGSHIDSALVSLPEHIARIKQAALARGRQVRTIINPTIVARETEKEAWEYAHSIIEHGIPDPHFGAFNRNDSDAHAWRGRVELPRQQGLGLGGNIEIIGDPDQVVAQIAALKATGIDGIQIGFYDFQPELEYFAAEILPRLQRAGLRL